MNKYEQEIFERASQSYLMGGDLHVVNFNRKEEINNKLKDAVINLEKEGLIEITFNSEQRARFKLTDKGIDLSSKSY